MKLIVVALIVSFFVIFCPQPVTAEGITGLEQQINLLANIQQTTNATPQPTNNSLGLIQWDPGNYNNIDGVYFEAFIRCASCSGGNAQADVQLFTDTGTAVTGSLLETTSGTYVLERSGDISSNLTNGEEYSVRIARDATSGTAGVFAARLIVVQNGGAITDTLTHVEMVNFDSTTATSYERLNTSPIYLWDDDVHPDLQSVKIEATIRSSPANTSYVALSSSSNCSSIVTGSEITLASTTFTRVQSGDIKANLSDDTEYWFCVKTSSSTTGSIVLGKIIIEQSSSDALQFIETYQQYINNGDTDSDTTYTANNRYNLFDPAQFTADIKHYFFEATLSTTAGTGFARLYDITGAAAIDNAELTTTSSSLERVRSANLKYDLPSSASEMDSQLKNSATNTTAAASTWLVIQLDNILDPVVSFSVTGTSAGAVYNGITTSVATSYSQIDFGNLTFNTPKYAAHSIAVESNAPGGYSVTVAMQNYLQGLYPGNDIDDFIAPWETPTTWTEPTGTTENIESGWIGANTTDTRVSGWSSASQKFGALNNSAHQVMYSTSADAGTTAYVTYALEVNIMQPADLYSGTIIYNFLPTY